MLHRDNRLPPAKSDYSNDQHRKPGGLVFWNSNDDDRYTDERINEMNLFMPQAGWLM